jgi:hypothetical protein
MKITRKTIQCAMLALLAGGLALPDARGFRKPNTHQELLPEFDARQGSATPPFSAPEQQASLSMLRSNIAGVAITAHSVLGTPEHVISSKMFLNHSGDISLGITAAAPSMKTVAAAEPVVDQYQPVKYFLNEYAPLFGEGETVLNSTTVKRELVGRHNGLRTTVWQQMLDSIPVFEGVLVANVTRRSELASVSSRLVPQIYAVADSSVPDRGTTIANPPVAVTQAVAIAAQNIGEVLEASQVTPVTAAQGIIRQQRFTAPTLAGKAYASLSWLPVSKTALRLCWSITLTGKSSLQMYRVLVDAKTGEVLIRRSQTRYISDASYSVYTGDSPTPLSPGCSTPCNTQPSPVLRAFLTFGALDPVASPDGWIPDGANTTSGNNANVYLNRDGDQFPEAGEQPAGSPNRVFNFSLDLSQDPIAYTNASVVQAFYWVNYAHDRFYALGFNEAAGNFQVSNFGKGGQGADAVETLVQTVAVQNNAYMSADAQDGVAPVMVLGIFGDDQTGPQPNRDSALDGQVVLHEYCHGVQERLVGGGTGPNYAAQTGGLMEGWSDYAALGMLTDPLADVDAVYPMGGYLRDQIIPGFSQNYYFGIRRYPYTTDMTKNPLTFKDIDPTQASIHPGVPISPLFSPASPLDADEVHNAGEVWCVTLWECRANLIKKLGAAGNDIMLQLMVDGMKLGPANPSYLEARDAILLADRVNYNGDNQAELWAAFAKRGMGVDASGPPGSSNSGIIESYDTPALSPKCLPTTIPATQTSCVTRNSRFWMTYLYNSANTNCATLFKAIEANGGNVCLGFLRLPVTYENRDSLLDSVDAVMEAAGLYWRKKLYTGEYDGKQDAKSPGSKLCKQRKLLAVELISAIANNVLFGTTPDNCGAFPSDLIEQAGLVADGYDVKAIKNMTSQLRQFNNSGMANPLPFDLELCTPYDQTQAKKIASDPTTRLTCPGPNDSVETASVVNFVVTSAFSPAIYQDSLNLSKYSNAFGDTCGLIGKYAVWKILPETGRAGRSFTVRTFESNFDTVVTVYRGNLTTVVGCDDDDPDHPPQSKVQFNTDGTNTYYLVVGGKAEQAGNLKIKVTSP